MAGTNTAFVLHSELNQDDLTAPSKRTTMAAAKEIYVSAEPAQSLRNLCWKRALNPSTHYAARFVFVTGDERLAQVT